MKKEFNIKKGKCVYAIYYDISDKQDRGSIRLWIEYKNHSELFLSNLIVSESYRKNGLGQKLLNYSEIAAKKLGIHRIALKVVRNSWMENWYKRNGFIEDYIWNEGERVVKYLHKDI